MTTRVLQVTAIPVTALRFVLPLARALAEAGFEVELATGPGRGLDALAANDFPVHRMPISRNVLGWRNLHAIGALRSLIPDYDVVHTHTPAASAVGRLAARRTGAAVLYTMHGSLWEAGMPWSGIFTLLERGLAGLTDRVFTVNPDDARDCSERAGIPPNRVVQLPAGGAGVADAFYRAAGDPAVRADARSALEIGPDAPVVGYVGRTAAAKGMAVLARAFDDIYAAERRARLLVVGGALEGDRDAYSESRFRQAIGPPAAGHVVWTGFRDRVAPLIAAMDVLILPSLREGFGMSLAEAAAVGRPVVASDTRGARAIVEHEVTGLRVPVGDAEALARAVLRLLNDAELRQRMRESARRRARAFTRQAVLDAYLEVYAALSNTGAQGVRP